MLDIDSDFQKPVVAFWEEQLKQAVTRKRPFTEQAAICMQFYCGAVGWMYDDQYRRQFTNAPFTPKFKVTLNKAFDVVASYGPTLYHRNPARVVRPHEMIKFGPEVFGDPQDPQAQALYAQFARADAIDHARAEARCAVTEAYLSATPRLQPGGLEQAATDAITEALIKGGGCLWPQAYRSPGSQRLLTGSFYDSIDNLLQDPDSETWQGNRWIAQRCMYPYWQFARSRNLPEDMLAKLARTESGIGQSERLADPWGVTAQAAGKTNDLVTVWKVWSKAGAVRARPDYHGAVNAGLARAFDEALGDFAYLEIVEGLPFPANAPTEKVREASFEDIQDMYRWPVPHWARNRASDGGPMGNWPCALLGFYHVPRWQWPLSIMAPVLGEMMILNIVMSAIVNRVWDGNKTVVAVLRSALKQLQAQLDRGDSLVVCELDQIHQTLDKVISVFQTPPMQQDVWKLAEWLSETIDKRTGLTEPWYGGTGGSQSRSAEDVSFKRQMSTIRTDDMAEEVDRWMGEVGELEKAAAYWAGVKGQDVEPIVGHAGAYIWDKLVAEEDPDVVLHQMEATVESGSSKRPNRDRDLNNMQKLFPALVARADHQADVTGDTSTLNSLVQKMAEAMEQPLEDIVFPPRIPLQMQQQQQQQEQQEQQMQQQPAAPSPDDEAAQQRDAEQHAQAMQQREQQHQQRMRHAEQRQETQMNVAEVRQRLARINATNQGSPV